MQLFPFHRLKSFILFEQPFNFQYLTLHFRRTHEKHQEHFDSWPIAATRRKLINDFWFWALCHYAALVAICGIVFLGVLATFNISYLLLVLVVGILLYLPLYVLLYRPAFTGDFLPKLETVISEFEGNQRIWAEKCKQEQLSTRGLVLLYYILDKCAEINFLTPSDKSASLLLKIFGVSQKGLKNELDLLFKKEKRAKIEQRKQTEITKSFEEVYAIFEEMQFPKGVQMLKELEIRYNRPE
ncbi:hypothetical protein [Chitinophaga rhizosphaerae]|uniref:hypothetical protein n=1 Tax=Chitinophaga rhizosphaerae TaxID=1864947 RepID=UPI000F8081A4|nr:hypothetical protein [Chitinophaga rhizosphaerae]